MMAAATLPIAVLASGATRTSPAAQRAATTAQRQIAPAAHGLVAASALKKTG